MAEMGWGACDCDDGVEVVVDVGVEVGVEEAEELRCSSRKASAVPLLCAAGMSSRQNVSAWVIAKVPEDMRSGGQVWRSSRFAAQSYHRPSTIDHQGQLSEHPSDKR